MHFHGVGQSIDQVFGGCMKMQLFELAGFSFDNGGTAFGKV